LTFLANDNLEAEPNAKAGTPPIIVRPIVGGVAVAIAIVRSIIRSVISVPVIRPVVRIITVTVTTPMTDLLHLANILALNHRKNARQSRSWSGRGDHEDSHT
jgi:hypothetical protein